ncbi:hypothetical protein QYF36_021431 [Acer negundo]|nr:hypothetical protein QYF36_021431 [Acer negundo]
MRTSKITRNSRCISGSEDVQRVVLKIRTRDRKLPKKENSSDEVKSKDVHKESGNIEDLDPSRKEGTRIEECDSSNKCTSTKISLLV